MRIFMEVTVSGSCAVTTEDIRVISDLRVLEGTCTEKKSICKSNNNSNKSSTHATHRCRHLVVILLPSRQLVFAPCQHLAAIVPHSLHLLLRRSRRFPHWNGLPLADDVSADYRSPR
ncbi:unnamed protein product, partial [Ectocarpus fasciculatus]